MPNIYFYTVKMGGKEYKLITGISRVKLAAENTGIPLSWFLRKGADSKLPILTQSLLKEYVDAAKTVRKYISVDDVEHMRDIINYGYADEERSCAECECPEEDHIFHSYRVGNDVVALLIEMIKGDLPQCLS